jgi:hypothetical protein
MRVSGALAKTFRRSCMIDEVCRGLDILIVVFFSVGSLCQGVFLSRSIRAKGRSCSPYWTVTFNPDRRAIQTDHRGEASSRSYFETRSDRKILQSCQTNWGILCCCPLPVRLKRANFGVRNRSDERVSVLDSRQPIGQENEWTTRRPNPFQHSREL